MEAIALCKEKMGAMPCLREQNTNQGTPGHDASKLPAVLSEVQTGNAYQRKGKEW